MSQLNDAPESAFIGLSDRFKEGTFLWDDQTTVDYTNWYLRQPSRYGNEDCVELLPYFKHHGRWNDIDCSQVTGFICQKSKFDTFNSFSEEDSYLSYFLATIG